jgi:ketosteroid isomerase-like protein
MHSLLCGRDWPSVLAAGLILGAVLAPLAVLAGCATTSVGRTRTVAESNREIVRAAFDRWRRGAGGPFELLEPDAKWTIVGSSPLSKTYPSRQQFLDEVIDPFNARLSEPLKPNVRGLYAAGDMVVVLFDGAATARDGLPYRNTYTWYLGMEDSRITNVVAFFDTRLFDEFWDRVPLEP